MFSRIVKSVLSTEVNIAPLLLKVFIQMFHFKNTFSKHLKVSISINP